MNEKALIPRIGSGPVIFPRTFRLGPPPPYPRRSSLDFGTLFQKIAQNLLPPLVPCRMTRNMSRTSYNFIVRTMKICAKWTDDCQGKKDFDGRIVSISTRYWPGRYQQNGRPSAKASITLNHGEPDDSGFGDYLVLMSVEFEADTEAQVKAMVETWAQEQFDRIHVALTALFGS